MGIVFGAPLTTNSDRVCLIFLQAELQMQSPQQRLSCNDVLSAVLWHVACDIRGRPRPWQGGGKGGHGCLAYPLNLRALHVPRHYCGNALLLNLLAGMTLYRHMSIELSENCCNSFTCTCVCCIELSLVAHKEGLGTP